MAHESILIVDDQPVHATLIRKVLAQEGYQISLAANAPEALQAVRNHKPVLILMDIHLPGMGGMELARFLKSNQESRHIKIVAISAYASTKDEAERTAADCDGYIAKPIDTRTFAGSVREILDR